MIKLIILGFLKGKAATGYDIKKFIEKQLGLFSEITTQSIYYPLKKLEEEGFIKKEIKKSQTHLKKYVYKITEKGEKEFVKLCNQTLTLPRRPPIDLDIPLYFLPFLPKKDVLIRLRYRRRFLFEAKKWLKDKLVKKDEFLPHQILLLTHHLRLLEAEEKFVEEFINFLKKNEEKDTYYRR